MKPESPLKGALIITAWAFGAMVIIAAAFLFLPLLLSPKTVPSYGAGMSGGW